MSQNRDKPNEPKREIFGACMGVASPLALFAIFDAGRETPEDADTALRLRPFRLLRLLSFPRGKSKASHDKG